jgi:7-cyano-7-deazaguanine synthase
VSDKAITLLSGGLDSVVATTLAVRKYDVVCALMFDYGQRACAREIDAARRLCKELNIEHRIIEIPWLAAWTKTALVDEKAQIPAALPADLDTGAEKRAKAVWVPNRNGVFVSIAASLAESVGAETIIAGFNVEEGRTFPDNSAKFVKAANAALALSTLKRVNLDSPTLHMTKAQIAKEFISLELPPDLFWCCYDGGKKMCGHCESCARTIRAFKEIGRWETIAHRFAGFAGNIITR